MANPIFVATNERLVCAGSTGSGKTYFVTHALMPKLPPSCTTVILDPKRDEHWSDVPSIKYDLFGNPQIERGKVQAFRWNIKLNDDSDEDLASDPKFIRLGRVIFEMKNVLSIFDETQAVYEDRYSMPRIWRRVTREGRQRNLGQWFLMQRPVDSPRIILTEAEAWAAFTLRNIDDRMRLAGYMGNAVQEQPPHPETDGTHSHVFWWVRTGMQNPVLKRVQSRRSVAA